MKTRMVLLLIVFSALSARSQQSGWVKQNASSLPVNLYGGHSIDANTLVIVGDRSRIVRSSDGGISWSIQASQVTEELYDIHFINSTTGWAAGSGGVIIKTTDGGNSWKYLNSGTTKDLNSVRFYDSQNGWVTGDSVKILKTSNGGETWTACYGGSSYYEMNDIYPLSTTSVIAFGYQSGKGFFRTIDGGQTWSTPDISGWIKDVCFLDNTRAWAVGITAYKISYTSDPWGMGGGGWSFDGLRGTIWKTTDGGATWASGVTTLSKWFYGVHFIDSNTGWAVGEGGLIMKTTDGGTQWSLPSSGTTNNLFAVCFLNAQTGWALGASGVLLKSTDGGSTWRSVSLGTTANLRNIRFIDSQTGWICGGSGLILKTTDGGTTWQQLSGGSSKNLRAVHFPDQQNGWAVGQGGIIQKTTDGGFTWISQTSAVPVQFSEYSGFNCVYFCNSTTGWAAGSNGTIVKTTDGGNQWVQQNSTTTKFLNSIYFINTTIGWIAGDNGTLLSTTNGGTTWTSRTSATSQDLNTVFFFDEQYGWSAGGSYLSPNYRNIIQRTTDGGLTWRSDSTEALAPNTALYFRDRTTGWMGNGYGHIFKSTDGGVSWRAQSTNSYSSITSICFTDASRGYAFYGYGVLKTTDGGGALIITPHPIAPLNQAKGINQNTTLVWSSSAGAQSYTVQVALSATFSGYIISEKSGVLDTTYSPTGLVAGNTYYWRVCAEYPNGTSFWTTPQSFEVLGMTWRTQVSGTTWGIKSVYFIDSQHGWIVGDYGTVLSSDNGGRIWVMKTISTGNYYLNSVFFTNSLSGWIVGDGGKIFRTTNGGLQWIEQQSGVTRNLKSVRFANASTGWIVGDNGTILKTIDGGNSWSSQSAGTTSNISSIAVLDENTALVACLAILRTTNGGATWISQTSSDAVAIHFATRSWGCAVGSNGLTLYSSNGGNTWAMQGSQLSYETLYCIQMVDSLHGWAAGTKGMFQYTADGGKTWQDKSIDATTYYYGMHALNDSTIWVVGSSGLILKSSRTPGVGNTQPLLVYPADQATGIMVRPTLQWSPVYGGVSYRLQVSPFSNFSPMTIDSNGIQRTSLTIGSLWNNFNYYWRVAAFDADGAGPWSSTRNFTTVGYPPSKALNSEPSNGSANITTNPTLKWYSISNATLYHLQVSLDSLFQNTVINDSTLVTTEKQLFQLSPYTKYYWRVRGSSSAGNGEWSDRWSFTTKGIAPSSPTLLSPVHGQTGLPLSTTCQWGVVKFAASYRFQIATDSLFSSFVLDKSLTDTLISVANLDSKCTYYWRVAGVNSADTGPWSSTWSFTTARIGPPRPRLLFPENTQADVPGSTTLRWSSSDGATGYGVQVSTSSTFQTSLVDQKVTDTSYAISGLQGGMAYYWRTRAEENTMTSGWSQTFVFYTAGGWKTITGPAGTIQTIKFISPSFGWAGTSMGQISISADRGITWISRSTSYATIQSFDFLDSLSGWAVGTSGTIQRTTDGGRTWMSQVSGTTKMLKGISFSDANNGWAVADTFVLRTTDGGSNWMPQKSSSMAFLNGVRAVSSTEGFLFGGGIVLKTIDGGALWTVQSLPGYAYLMGVYFLDRNIGWASGADGVLLKTTNGGTTWKFQASGTANWLTSVHFADANIGWAVGWNGTIIKSTNGGDTWGVQRSGTTSSLYTVFAIDASTVVAGGGTFLRTGAAGGVALYPPQLLAPADKSTGVSTNPVLSWTAVPAVKYRLQIGMDAQFYSFMNVVDDTSITTTTKQVSGLVNYRKYYWRVMAKTAEGLELCSVAWTFTTGSTTGIDQLTGLPATFALYQNYPNPFNPSTIIRFSLPKSAHVNLKIISILGQEMATLIDESKGPGQYEVRWNAADAPSGVYFYRLQAAEFVDTKRMILLR